MILVKSQASQGARDLQALSGHGNWHDNKRTLSKRRTHNSFKMLLLTVPNEIHCSHVLLFKISFRAAFPTK